MEDYEPGHVEMWYGQGLTVLGTIRQGEVEKLPTPGEIMVEFCVNGEWEFIIKAIDKDSIPNDLVSLAGRYNTPDDITPEIEEIIKGEGRFDDATFTHNGIKYNIEWIYNNWFEIFTYVYNGNDTWDQLDDGELVECDLGPTPEEMVTLVEDLL